MTDILNSMIASGFPEMRALVCLIVLLVSLIGAALVSLFLRPVCVPVLWRFIDLLFGRIGDKLNRAGRRAPDLFFRGFVLLIAALFVVVAFIGSLPYVLSFFGGSASAFYFAEGVILLALVSAPGMMVSLLQLYKTIQGGRAGEGVYLSFSRGALANVAGADDYAITRLALGVSVRRFNDALMAPLFWYCIFGLEGAILFAAFSAMNWRFGERGFDNAFGMGAYAGALVMGYVPMFLSAVLLWFAALFTPRAAKGFVRSYKATFCQGGYALDVMAHALGAALGGAYMGADGRKVKGPWAGDESSSAKVELSQLRRGAYMLGVAHLLLILGFCGAYLFFA